MAQRITPFQGRPPSEEILNLSSTKQGLGAMTLPETRPNMSDGGNWSKPYSNPQDQLNAGYSLQSVRQNAISQYPQEIARQEGEMRNMMSSQSTQNARTQRFNNDYLARVIEATSGGQKIKDFNSVVTGPGQDKFKNDIKVSQMMSEPAGEAPELGKMMKMANQGMA